MKFLIMGTCLPLSQLGFTIMNILVHSLAENIFNHSFSNNILRWIDLDSDFKQVFSETRHGKSLWKTFLVAAIVFLLIETILSAPNTKKLKIEKFDE